MITRFAPVQSGEWAGSRVRRNARCTREPARRLGARPLFHRDSNEEPEPG